MLQKFKKIKGLGVAEAATRGRQGVSILAELLGISRQCRLINDDELFRMFRLPESDPTGKSLFEYFKRSGRAPFFDSFTDLEWTIKELNSCFPEHVEQLLFQAEKIRKGYFDLLGYKDLYFNGNMPDWHFDPIWGKESPKRHWSLITETDSTATGDKKIIWELNRHQYFLVLGQAYQVTKDERYAQLFVEHLKNWIENNPPKIGVNWLSSLEISFRSISWIWAFHFFADSPNLTPDVFVRMLKYLILNGRHIEAYLSTYFSPNTHLTGEALGLYFLGMFLPEIKEARRWKALGYRILMSALDIQVREDGVYCEQASHYQRYTVDFYSTLLVLRRLGGDPVDPKHVKKLDQLIDFLLHITQPNGETPLLGDDDGGRFLGLGDTPITDVRSTLALGAVLLERGDLKFAAKEPGPEILWLLGPSGLRNFDSLPSVRPAETAKGFEAGGYFVARNDWEPSADYLLIDCGPHGFLSGGHAHADVLSFVLCFDGKPAFIDSGTFNYTADLESRNYFRSTSAHNCLTVNGESSSIPGGPFSWESTADGLLLEWNSDGIIRFRGTHEGFMRMGVSYEREIEFDKGGSLTIVDSINSLYERTFELHFILAPSASVKSGSRPPEIFLDGDGAEETRVTVETEIIGCSIGDPGEWREDQVFFSECYGAKTPTTKLTFTVTAQGEFQIRNRFTKLPRRMSPR